MGFFISNTNIQEYDEYMKKRIKYERKNMNSMFEP